jgi:hypothetical protein
MYRSEGLRYPSVPYLYGLHLPSHCQGRPVNQHWAARTRRLEVDNCLSSQGEEDLASLHRRLFLQDRDWIARRQGVMKWPPRTLGLVGVCTCPSGPWRAISAECCPEGRTQTLSYRRVISWRFLCFWTNNVSTTFEKV